MVEPSRAGTEAAAPSPSGIFLIGPMGSGKSAVGRALARLCHRDFYDSDAEIERRTGVDINFIFEKEGEPGFRAREREVIDDLTRRPGIVLATGGGAVLSPENRAALSGRGIAVYLEASLEQQFERTRHGRHRPLLQAVDPAERLAELMRVREPLYRATASIVVATDRRRVQTVAEQISQELQARGIR
jgi:shikimate kinase